jgi:hypothetical protein
LDCGRWSLLRPGNVFWGLWEIWEGWFHEWFLRISSLVLVFLRMKGFILFLFVLVSFWGF